VRWERRGLSETPGERDSDYRHHDPTPGSAPDRSAAAAVPDSFPASDPVATTAVVGARAMDPARLMPDTALDTSAASKLVVRFPDLEQAKLALERLVREIPLDRRCMTTRADSNGCALEVMDLGANGGRIAALLQGCGAEFTPGDTVRREIARLRGQLERLLRERAAPAASQAIAAAGGYARQARAAAATGTERTATVGKEQPLMTLAVVAAVAFLLGRLSSSDSKR